MRSFFILLLVGMLFTLSSALAYEVSQSDKLALTNVILIDGLGGPAKSGQTILIEKGKISSVQDANKTIPSSFELHDLSGHTVTPGFVMMHEHMFYPTGLGNYTEMVHSFPKLYLAGGATTIRTAGTTAPYADLNLKQGITDKKLIGPDMDVTAPYLNGPGLPILKIKALRGEDNASDMVKYWLSEGVSSYKLYMHIRQNEMKTIIDLAHANKQKVTGHLCSITFREATDLGIDNLEHGFVAATDFVNDKKTNACPSRADTMKSLLDLSLDDPRMTALINHLVKNNVAITSTLTIYETFAKGRPVAYPEAIALMNEQVKHQYLNSWSNIQASDNDDWSQLLKKEMAWEKAFVDAGGHLMVGTDPTGYGGVIAGWSNIRAIELLVEAGFDLTTAFKLATMNGATFLDQQKSIGSIEVGKRANIAVFDGDLTKNLQDIRKIKWSVKDGVVYDSNTIFNSMKGKVGLH